MILTDPTSAVRHDKGLFDAHGHITCDCGGQCPTREDFDQHVTNTYNNPTLANIAARGKGRWLHMITIEPSIDFTIDACTKVACHAQGNGRDCWTLTVGETRLYELPSRRYATDLALSGGLAAEVYTLSFC